MLVLDLSVVLPCPSVIEMAALAGYDFVRIDWEHALFGAIELRELLNTARLVGMPCQVRVPELTMITPLLGQEPAGIMVPHVESEKGGPGPQWMPVDFSLWAGGGWTATQDGCAVRE